MRIWLLQLATALIAAGVAAGVGLTSAAAYPETRLMRAAVLFVLAATLVCAGSDRLVSRRASLGRRATSPMVSPQSTDQLEV